MMAQDWCEGQEESLSDGQERSLLEVECEAKERVIVRLRGGRM